MSGKIKFQNEKLDQVVNLYKTGMTLGELATKFNCGKDAVRSAMNRAGVKTRTGYERKYNVNDNYFETIDTEGKAGEKAFKLSKTLYENASVYLDRKFECYELFTNKFDWLL